MHIIHGMTEAFQTLDSTLQAVAFALLWYLMGLVFVYLTNYAFPNKVWDWRFREINEEDHAGPLLESSMLLLFVVLALVTGAFFYPESSGNLLLTYVFAWPGAVVCAGLFALVAFVCLRVTPRGLDDEFNEKDATGRPCIAKHNKKFADLTQEQWDHHLRIVKTRTEVAYQFLCFMLGASLLLGIVFLVGGVKGDIETWSADHGRLQSAITDLTNWTESDESILVPEVIRDAEMVTPAYTVLVDHTIPAYEKYLGVIAILFAIGFWFVGTGYQKVYTEAVANMMKYFALLILFVVLPVVLVTGYASLVSAANDVTHALTAVSIEGLEQARAAEASLADEDQVTRETDWLRDFGDVRARFDEQVLSTGFFTRMATSWGGAWMLLWFAVSIVFKERKKLLMLLIPPFSKKTKEFVASLFVLDILSDSFFNQDEDDQDE